MAKQRIAPHDLYGVDAEGVRRLVRRGSPIPRNLTVSDDIDYGATEAPEQQLLRDRHQVRTAEATAPLSSAGIAEMTAAQRAKDNDGPADLESAFGSAYDELSEDEVLEGLDELGEFEIAVTKAYEARHLGRESILTYGDPDPGTEVEVPEGVIPGETPGWPVDSETGLLLDLTDEQRNGLIESAKAEGGPAVPFDGYDEANIRDIKKRLAAEPELVESVKAYERANKDRPAIVNYGA